MAMTLLLRLLVLTLLPALLGGRCSGAQASGIPAAPAKSVEYKRVDANFYARGDVLKADPEAIILPPTAFAQNGDIYSYMPQKKSPRTLYLEVPTDWVEPITPPDMPASLNIAPDAMQIREPHGDVEVAQPNAPTTFASAADGQPVPDGAVIKTGPNSTAAILFGGVDSARLMPNSEVAVEQAVASTSRAAEVDLTAGGVFSKVGTQVGVSGSYEIHTPNGTVQAAAGDFATLTLEDHTDIWVSQGIVELMAPDGKKFGTVAANGTGPLKLIRYPAIGEAAHSQQADAESLTAIMNFLPMANQKLAALHQKAALGVPLSTREQAYLQRIKQVPALIKLQRITSQPATPAVAAAPALPATAETPPPVPGNAQLSVKTLPAPAPEFNGTNFYGGKTIVAATKLLSVIAHADGTIKFQGKTMKIDAFTAKIKAAVAANPDLAVIIHSNPKMDYAKFEAVVDACKNAPAKEVAVVPPAPQPPSAAPALPVTAETPPAPVNTKRVPAEIDLAADGSLKLDGAAVTEDDLRSKLADLKQTNPKNPLVLMKAPGVTKAQWMHEVDLAHSLGLKLLVKDAKGKGVAATPLKPKAEVPPALRPSAAEGGPVAPSPATNAGSTMAIVPPAEAVPVEIELTPDGQVSFLGEAVNDAELKTRLANVAQNNAQVLVLVVKDEKVSRDQLQHVIDLCHAVKLKVKVKTVKSTDMGALKPHAQLPGALESSGGMRELPIEIGLENRGRLTFDGTALNLDELKERLATIGRVNPGQPVVIVKQPEVPQDSVQALVMACREVSPQLKISVKAAPAFAPPSLPDNFPADNAPRADAPLRTSALNP